MSRAFAHEIDSLRTFARAFPDHTTLLIDTYDTATAAHKAATVGREMEARGQRLGAVRLDSGDMLALSREVRAILDAAGLSRTSESSRAEAWTRTKSTASSGMRPRSTRSASARG
jgi:nicotinic acid phosphoribosyltransferase